MKFSGSQVKQNTDPKAGLRVGIIGCGKVAHHHARFVRELAGVQLLGVADVNEQAAREFAATYAIPSVYGSVETLLGNVELDVVHVVTPPAYHYECAKTALDRGVSVLLEKPMAFTTREVADLYDRAAASGASLCPDFIHLFHPRMRQLLRLLESGALGRVVHVESRLCLDLREESEDLRQSKGLHWAYQLPGGLLRDYASHALYLALYFAGPPLELQVTRKSRGNLPQDLIDHVLVQAEGVHCTAHVTLSCAPRPSCLELRIFGEKGSAQLNFDTQTLLVHGLRSLPRKIALAGANFIDAWKLSASGVGNIANYLRGKVVPFGGLRVLIPAFYECLRGARPLPVSRKLATAVTTTEENIFAGATPPLARGQYCPSAQGGITQKARVLVTGASGYIGSAVVKALVQDGYCVRALARPTSALERLRQMGVEIFLGDVRNFDEVNAAAEDMDIAIHLAAGLKGTPEFIVDSSLQGAQNIAKAALLQRLQRVIYMSSMSVYDLAKLSNGQTLTEDSPLEEQAEQRGAYSLGKRRAEEIALARLADKQPAWTILRPSAVVGNGSDVIAPVGWKLGKNLVCLSSPRKRLLLIHVEDVAAAILQLVRSENTKGAVYTLSHQDTVTVRQYVASSVRPYLCGKVRVIYVPYFLARLACGAGAVMAKIAGLSFPLNRRRLYSVYRNVRANSERLRLDTGWQPSGNLLQRLHSEASPQTSAAQMPASDVPQPAVTANVE